jgi:Na+/H+ antiporter
MEYGFLSVLPPIIAIVLALRTKQVYIALLFGIWCAWLILNNGNPLKASLAMVEGLVAVFEDKGSTRTIIFSALVGALLIFIQYSKGVVGFINIITKKLNSYETKKTGYSRVMVQILATITGLLLFVETSISSLTVGTLYRPIFDKLKIPREKLAYIADSSSAPSSILIPFNAWGAFIMGLLLTQGIEKPFGVLIASIKYNFYPLLAIAIVFIIIFSKKDFWAMKRAEERTKTTGELMNKDAKPMVSDAVTAYPPKAGIQAKAYNMIVPLLVMVIMMPISLIYTGWDAVKNATSFVNHAASAIGEGVWFFLCFIRRYFSHYSGYYYVYDSRYFKT